MAKTTLYWLRQDLRIEDNQALNLAAQSDALLCVFIVDPAWFKPQRYQLSPMGWQRWTFLQTSLTDLQQSLLKMGQRLHVIYDSTLTTLISLCRSFDIERLVTSQLPGSYEQNLIKQLQLMLPTMEILSVEQYTLFNLNHLPFPVNQLPASYAKFRRKVANIPVLSPLAPISQLPPMPRQTLRATLALPSWLPTNKSTGWGYAFVGGEQQGLRHLAQYFSSDYPSYYKQRRNELDGWENSSKLSPWLNLGCLSPRQVYQQIKSYEQHSLANESSQWLLVELLWREYFQWLHYKIGNKLFYFKGLKSKGPLTNFYPHRFKQWCLGQTPYPLVNACMNKLRSTGYLSNRGRQIAASCLVNELALDWRYGAAWFEQQLLDYDVAVNWGNWQYIAGVGVDPRGGRHFNLEIYDPDGHYRQKWLGPDADIQAQGLLDHVDAADWPVDSVAKASCAAD